MDVWCVMQFLIPIQHKSQNSTVKICVLDKSKTKLKIKLDSLMDYTVDSLMDYTERRTEIHGQQKVFELDVESFLTKSMMNKFSLWLVVNSWFRIVYYNQHLTAIRMCFEGLLWRLIANGQRSRNWNGLGLYKLWWMILRILILRIDSRLCWEWWLTIREWKSEFLFRKALSTMTNEVLVIFATEFTNNRRG